MLQQLTFYLPDAAMAWNSQSYQNKYKLVSSMELIVIQSLKALTLTESKWEIHTGIGKVFVMSGRINTDPKVQVQEIFASNSYNKCSPCPCISQNNAIVVYYNIST